jgi:hypothetical protein
MGKLNCWEVMQCGREPGGARESELGACPVGLERRLDTVHGGCNAGRACWIVAGSLCGGEVQGTFAAKYQNCKKCEFYQRVQKEEYPAFKLAPVLLAMMGR